MKRKFITLGLVLLATQMNAQDIYKTEMLSSSDLNGTARYVGMGGAMNALGANLSTMGVNPAGIGFFRSSDVSMTGSVLIEPNAKEMMDVNKARASFDQIGFVYAAKMGGGLQFVNFGFNYQKSRNMKNFINVSNFKTGGLSQTWEMMDLSFVNNRWLDLNKEDDRNLTTPLTCLGYDTQMLLPEYDSEGKVTNYIPVESESYDYQRVQWGGINSYDFNLSLNWDNSVYAGITLGVKDVDIHTGTYYQEMVLDENRNTHPYFMANEEALTGTGFDLALGIILRPIETSPFRIGFSVKTPTWYDVKSDAYLYMKSPFATEQAEFTEADVDVVGNEYKVRTPWKVNLSMATTIGKYLALDAEYEYSKHPGAKISYFSYDDYGYYSNGDDDRALNQEIRQSLKGVSTFKVGAEARLTNNLYARAGYNYVSAPFKKNAFLNLFTNSSSYFYNVNTDYVNLGATQRATCGLGYKFKHLYADIAYQYQTQSGDVYTFHVPEENSMKNQFKAAKVDLNRHNIMLSVGYKF